MDTEEDDVALSVESKILKGGSFLGCGCLIKEKARETFGRVTVIYMAHYIRPCTKHLADCIRFSNTPHFWLLKAAKGFLSSVVHTDGRRVTNKAWEGYVRTFREDRALGSLQKRSTYG